MSRRFLIAGCQRSGTTLMRLALEMHPKVTCVDEPFAYRALRGDEPAACTPPEKTVVGYKVPRWTEQLNDEWLFDPGVGVWARRFYRGEPIVFLLRDVRDVVASMLTLSVATSNWWAVRGSMLLQYRLQLPPFRERYQRDLELARTSPAAAAALYWKSKTQAFFDYHELGYPVYGIRYEDLVTNPASELKRVLEFLDLDWDDRVLSHHQQSHGQLLASGLALGATDPQRPIDNTSLGKWRQTLNPAEIKSTLAIAGDLNDRLAGDLDGHRACPAAQPKKQTALSDRACNVDPKLAALLDWLVAEERAVVTPRRQVAGNPSGLR